MPKPFNPPTKDDRIVIKVSVREAHLIKILRGYRYGRVVVHKVDGRLVRVESNESKLLNGSEGMELAVKEKEKVI